MELDALPPPKRTLIFGVRIWRGLFLRDRAGKGTRTAGGTSGMKGPHLTEIGGCAEVEDRLSRGCSGPDDVQHFPEFCSGIFSLVS